jgi:glycine dehydrogenase subunit 2
MNFGVDNGLYPLGSCTMKYNPKYCDHVAALPSVTSVHPNQEEDTVQGSLHLMYELEQALCKISGMDAVTLQPAAGAHGEFTGMLIVKAYHAKRGDKRIEVIVPDAAHGTNPASAAMAGYNVIEIPSDADGCVDLGALKSALSGRTAAFMITNPNTLGIFEGRIREVA